MKADQFRPCDQCEGTCTNAYECKLTCMEDDPDDDFEQEEDFEEPDYYECLGCNKSWTKRPAWGQCTFCSSIVEEGYY